MDVINLVFSGPNWWAMIENILAASIIIALLIYIPRSFTGFIVKTLLLLAMLKLELTTIEMLSANYDAAVSTGSKYDIEFFFATVLAAGAIAMGVGMILQPYVRSVHRWILEIFSRSVA